MNPTNIRIARRLAVYMLSVAEQQVDLQFFQGLGFALAIVFEEVTGRSAAPMKPKELLEWAKDLPQEFYTKVTH